jgi:hypothetical protein
LYCNFRRKDEQKPVDLLANLLKQLLPGLPNIPASVRRLYKHHKGKQTRPSFDEISKELHVVANSYLKRFIIVDALDECQVTDGGRRKFLSKLFTLQTKTTVSFLATSRFIPEIANKFAGKCVSLEIQARDEEVPKLAKWLEFWWQQGDRSPPRVGASHRLSVVPDSLRLK